MTQVKFLVKKTWYEQNKEITVEADSVYDVQDPMIISDLLNAGHGELVDTPKRRGRPPKEEKVVEPSYEKKVVEPAAEKKERKKKKKGAE